MPEHRAWADELLGSAPRTRHEGVRTLAEHTVVDERGARRDPRATRAAGLAWGARAAADRAAVLQRAGDALESARGRLIEVMVSEAAKTIDQADPEVSEAIDFARYYAARAPELEAVDGAEFHPAALTLVTPPWNFPVAIPAGGVLAALAAGQRRRAEAGGTRRPLRRAARGDPLVRRRASGRARARAGRRGRRSGDGSSPIRASIAWC